MEIVNVEGIAGNTQLLMRIGSSFLQRSVGAFLPGLPEDVPARRFVKLSLKVVAVGNAFIVPG